MGTKAPDAKHYKPLSELNEWSGNYNEGDIGAIAVSIQKFGFNGALRVWQGNETRAGNHTQLALKQIKQQGETAPENILVVNGDWFVRYVDISHLSERESRAFAIADNRTAELAAHDGFLLQEYLEELASDSGLFEATGYDFDDLDDLINDLSPLSDLAEIGTPEANSLTMIHKKNVVRVLVYVEDLATFEKALRSTGLMNRGDALTQVCEAYLNVTG